MKKLSLVAVFAVALFGQAGLAHASTLSLSKTSDSLGINQYDQITASPANGDTVLVTSNSSPNVASATTTGSADVIQVQGLLAGSTNITICTTDESECSTVYVTVAGGASSTLNFSNSNPTVSAGQTTSIAATNATASTLSISSNSSPSTVSVSTAGQNVTITGVSYGSSSIVVCAAGTSQCGTLFVTVGSGSGTSGSLSFSNSSPNVSVGQSSTDTVYGGSGSYYVSNNSNSSIATVSLSGSNLTIYGSTVGTTNVTICDSNGSAGCSTLYVTVGGSGSSTGVTFSNTNPNVPLSSSLAVTLYGPSGYSFYISSNSNPNTVSTSLSGTTLTLYGLESGSASIAVCTSGLSECGTLYATVNGNGSSTGVTFSNANPNVPLSSSIVVSLYGPSGYQFYVSSNSSPNVVSTSILQNTLTLFGLESGSSTISVCVSGLSECGTLYATVNGNGSSSSVTFSTTNPTLSTGQTVSDAIYGASTYYISVNSSPTIISSTISGSNLSLYGIQSGTSTLTVCSLTNTSQCSTVTATVNGTSTTGGTVSFLTTSLPAATADAAYTEQLSVTGGTPSYTYTVYSGILPAGLTLTSTGQITGTPSAPASTDSFSVRASDTYGNSAIENLTLTVQPPQPGLAYNSGSTGSSTYHDGTLVNDGGTIYVVYKGSKTPFASASAFLGLGYSFASVVNGSTSSLTLSGTVISSASAAHPYGSWIDSNGTVYFVHATGLIPVPSASVFTSNNGQWDLVVPANSADMAMTVLSVMQPGDSRVQ